MAELVIKGVDGAAYHIGRAKDATVETYMPIHDAVWNGGVNAVDGIDYWVVQGMKHNAKAVGDGFKYWVIDGTKHNVTKLNNKLASIGNSINDWCFGSKLGESPQVAESTSPSLPSLEEPKNTATIQITDPTTGQILILKSP